MMIRHSTLWAVGVFALCAVVSVSCSQPGTSPDVSQGAGSQGAGSQGAGSQDAGGTSGEGTVVEKAGDAVSDAEAQADADAQALVTDADDESARVTSDASDAVEEATEDVEAVVAGGASAVDTAIEEVEDTITDSSVSTDAADAANSAVAAAGELLSPKGAEEAVKVFGMVNGEWRMWGGNASRNMVNPFAKGVPHKWDVRTGKNIVLEGGSRLAVVRQRRHRRGEDSRRNEQRRPARPGHRG